MKINTENTINREMRNGRKEIHHLPVIQHPSEDSQKLLGGNHLHHQVQHAEQNAMSESRITKNPAKGDTV